MPNGSHMDAHRTYDSTVVRLFKCIFILGPRAVNMIQDSHHLHLALITIIARVDISSKLVESLFSH